MSISRRIKARSRQVFYYAEPGEGIEADGSPTLQETRRARGRIEQAEWTKYRYFEQGIDNETLLVTAQRLYQGCRIWVPSLGDDPDDESDTGRGVDQALPITNRKGRVTHYVVGL